MISISECSQTRPSPWLQVRDVDPLTCEIDPPGPTLTPSIDFYACHSAAANRLHQLQTLMEQLRTFSPTEMELVWWMSQLNGHDERYAADTSGLIYLQAAVVAGEAARHIPLAFPLAGWTPISQAIPPTGTQLDKTV